MNSKVPTFAKGLALYAGITLLTYTAVYYTLGFIEAARQWRAPQYKQDWIQPRLEEVVFTTAAIIIGVWLIATFRSKTSKFIDPNRGSRN